MTINDIKVGETYYIIYEFSPHRGPEVEQCICSYKAISEKLGNAGKILKGAVVKFKLDSKSINKVYCTNEFILHESTISTYVFKTKEEADNALLKLKL